VLAALLAALLAGPSSPVPVPPRGPEPTAQRAALDLLYDGSTDAALERLDAMVRAHPDDGLSGYLAALALCWKVEQRADMSALDADLERRIDHVIAQASAQLREAPDDARARLALGGAFGVRSRLYILRDRTHASARAAAGMRDALLPLRSGEAYGADAAFGLGLYDYFVDVLPGVARLLRFLVGLPGGDRTRGLAAIESAKAHSELHQVEAAWQLYRIHALYEDEPDLALADVSALRARYSGAPFWALRLAEHERERTGRYARSAAVAGEIVAASARGERNYGPSAGALGRLAQGEALLLDLRLSEAVDVLRGLEHDPSAPPGVAARGRLLLGRALELSGDRAAALPHYRAAAATSDGAHREAERALSAAWPERERNALPHVAAARRHREAGRVSEAAAEYRRALAAWPDCTEARLRVAEDGLRHGEPSAPALVAALSDVEHPQPPWVRPWTWLLRAWVADLEGHRAAATALYKEVLKKPHADVELAEEARAGLARPFRPTSSDESAGRSRYH
jgi:hypothetical protein